jgi:proline racemase
MAPSLIELELQRVRHAVGRLAVELDAAEVEYDAWMADGEGTDVQAVQVPAGALRLEVPVHRDSVEDDAGRAQVDSASEPLVEVIVDRELAAVDVHAAVQAGERVRQVAESSPKTKKGIRTLSLDAGTVEVLRAHRVRQAAARLAWGAACVDSGLVITMETAADCSRSTSLDCSRKRAATVASR